jgi:hypothetical protein
MIGVGAHHKNAVAEQVIGTVTRALYNVAACYYLLA